MRSAQRVLEQHIRRHGHTFRLSVDKDTYMSGTDSVIYPALSSIDVFHLLSLPSASGGMLEADDFSFLLGSGRCTPADFAALSVLNMEVESLCSNLESVFHTNSFTMKTMLKYSLQPKTPLLAPGEAVRDLGLSVVTRNLVKSAELKTVDALPENENARVLYCSDTVDNMACNSLRTVMSSEGYSLGINVDDQRETVLEGKKMDEFFNLFLDHEIEPYMSCD